MTFYDAVYVLVRDIPRGRVMTYGQVAAALGVTLERAAEGILRVAVETMARAIRRVSVERGVDPRSRTPCATSPRGPAWLVS